MSDCWMIKCAEVLRRAAAIHARRGGAKGAMQDDQGRVCMWGAIACALGWADTSESSIMMVMFSDLIGHLTDVMRQVFRDGFTYPGARWNDLSTTTDEDVEKLLLQVADQCEIGDVTLRVLT